MKGIYNMQDVKLSVLITTYNLEKYIEQTILSVINQRTDYRFEILVGDDGSSDKTADIVRKWQERYPDVIKLYIMDRDKNVKYNRIDRASKNRINLINHASGEYLIFLDGDDFYTDEYKLDKQLKLLESKEYEDCIACGHNMWTYYSEDEKIPINRQTKKTIVSAKDYWKYGMYLHSDSIMFRNIFKDGFPYTIPESYYDDNIIMFCLLSKGDIAYLPDKMACYRQLKGSSWNSVSDLEKNIINLIDLDIEFIIDKSFKKESILRHLYPIFYIWLHGEELTGELYDKYKYEIEEKKLSWTKHWLNYEKLGGIKKFKMTAWLFAMLVRYVFIKTGRVAFKKYL